MAVTQATVAGSRRLRRRTGSRGQPRRAPEGEGSGNGEDPEREDEEADEPNPERQQRRRREARPAEPAWKHSVA